MFSLFRLGALAPGQVFDLNPKKVRVVRRRHKRSHPPLRGPALGREAGDRGRRSQAEAARDYSSPSPSALRERAPVAWNGTARVLTAPDPALHVRRRQAAITRTPSAEPRSSLGRRRRSTQQAAQEKIDVIVGELVLLDRTFHVIPLVEPVDDAKQRKSGDAGRNQNPAAGAFLDLGDQFLEKLDVRPLARINFLAQRAFQ